MTLLVNTFTRSPDGAMQLAEPAEQSQELAGFESYRRKVYGGAMARSLGLQILPTLASSDLYVEGNDVARLLAEAELALANVEVFAAEAETTTDSLAQRFQNIATACRHALSTGGGVVIW
jgi:hypothetical protein